MRQPTSDGPSQSLPAFLMAPEQHKKQAGDHMKTMVSGVMSSRLDPTTILVGDQYVFRDGVKAGLEGNFMSLIKTGRQVMQKHKRTIKTLYKFESVVAKREREKETTEMNVVKQVILVSHDPHEAAQPHVHMVAERIEPTHVYPEWNSNVKDTAHGSEGLNQIQII